MIDSTSTAYAQLPLCPEGFVCRRVGGGGELDRLGHLPSNCLYVASVEFTMSMINTYDEDYYVRGTRSSRAWELWSDGFDDVSETRIIEVYAIGPYMRIPPKTAAVHLLRAAWADTYGRTPSYIVTGEGLLSAEETHVIFESLFPEPTETRGAEPASPVNIPTEETIND